MMNNFFKINCGLILALILAVNVFRFIGLEKSPPGFIYDEMGSAVTIQCLATEGIDARDVRYPFFSDLWDYGTPKPPTYLYSGIVWTKIFGFSITSFRSFSGFWAVLTILGLGLLANQLLGRTYALLVVLAASISPWGWVFSRIAFEPILSPCFLVWAFVFYFRSSKITSQLLAGILFSLAMYSYPPTRVQVPLLIIPLFYFQYKRGLSTKLGVVGFFSGLFLTSIPLVLRILNGSLQGRFNRIGIFSSEYLTSIGKTNTFLDITSIFFKNMLLHFSPSYLFVNGGENNAYALHKFGQLSWVDGFALAIGVICLIVFLINTFRFKKENKIEFILVGFLVVNILIGIVPAALTWDRIPHSLRSLGAWPFFSLLSGYFLFKMVEKFKFSVGIVLALSIVFLYSFLTDYFYEYPKRAFYMFDGATKALADEAKTEADWFRFLVIHRNKDFNTRYYLMNYKDISCSQSKIIRQNIKKKTLEKGLN